MARLDFLQDIVCAVLLDTASGTMWTNAPSRARHFDPLAAFQRLLKSPRTDITEEHARPSADEAVARGFRRLGLLGTRWLVESAVYPDVLLARAVSVVRPEAVERDEMNRIIMDELVCSIFRPQAVAWFQHTIARMRDGGCDAVVLGCTEIPLIIHDENSPLPTLDSTRLLARAALRRAVA